MKTGDGRELPRHLHIKLNHLRRLLVITLELDRKVETERDRAADAKPADSTCRKIGDLYRIRGIGANLQPYSRENCSSASLTTAGNLPAM